MHNLHLIRLHAKDGEEAVSIAESELLEWGTENNWRTFGGAISKSGEVYRHDTEWARWIPDDTTDLSDIGLGFVPLPIDRDKVKKILESKSHIDWHILSRMAERESERLKAREKFDVWEDELYPFQYDEPGVTPLDFGGEGDPWIVFLDMHS